MIQIAPDKELAAHLVGKHREDFEAEAAAFARMKLSWQPHTIVTDDKFTAVLGVMQQGGDAPLTTMRKGVLKAVRQRFIEREGQWHEPLLLNGAILYFQMHFDLV